MLKQPSRRFVHSLAVSLVVCCSVFSQPTPSDRLSTGLSVDPQLDSALRSSVYLKVQLEKAVKISALKPGDVIEGKLAQDAYSGEHELFAAGSAVHLKVDKLTRRQRVPNDHWPWIVKVFTPRHENCPTFQSATISLSDGKEVRLSVSLIFMNRETEVQAQSQKKGSDQTKTEDAGPKQASSTAQTGSRDKGPVLILAAANPYELSAERESSSGFELPLDVTLASGTQAKIILLDGVSASKSHPGDSFQARLVEPVWLNAKVVLPEGTLLRGKIVATTRPRMLSRAGSLLLSFTDLSLPGGVEVPAVASVTAAELDQRSRTKIDPEGKLHGDRPGKLWMAINLGVTGGIAKVADDGTQLLVEALISTATDVSTAGTARIVGMCASGLFLLTRHGRDVVLPQFTEMNIVFDRPVSLAATRSASSAP